MQKRRPFLLVEIMIALVIMASAVSLLFTGFYGAMKGRLGVEKKREEVLELQRLRLKFSILFRDVIQVEPLEERESYYLRYQGGIDPDPRFRSEIEAVLQVKNKQLTLTSWSKEGAARRELLSNRTRHIQLLFFHEEKGEFKDEFPPQKPVMMKVILNKNKKETIPLFL